MNVVTKASSFERRGLLLAAGSLAALVLIAQPALSQTPPGVRSVEREQYCMRLEGQLAALDRGEGGSEQARRLEELVGRQQQELDQMTSQSRRMGCERTGFFPFGGGQSPQCDGLNQQIQRTRTNLDRMIAASQQARRSDGGRERRQAIMAALSQNGCGAQYQAAAPAAAAAPQRPRGFFETLFGGNVAPPPAASAAPSVGMPPETGPSGAFRTVCVRTCDGSFFPMSYSTTSARFADDERACKRACPAAEVSLYTYRNPGEEIAQAVSIAGKPYTELPTAFRYRQEYNAACTCKRPGESWAAAVPDDSVARGDIVVTEEKAKAMSQPKPEAAPRPQRQRRDAASAQGNAPSPPAQQPPKTAATANPAPATGDPPRTIGPQFIPPR